MRRVRRQAIAIPTGLEAKLPRPYYLLPSLQQGFFLLQGVDKRHQDRCAKGIATDPVEKGHIERRMVGHQHPPRCRLEEPLQNHVAGFRTLKLTIPQVVDGRALAYRLFRADQEMARAG